MALIVYRVMRQRLKLAKSALSPEAALDTEVRHFGAVFDDFRRARPFRSRTYKRPVEFCVVAR